MVCSHMKLMVTFRHVMVMKMPCLDTIFTVMVMARSRYSQLNLSALLSVTCCFKLMYVITSPSCRHLNALAKDDRTENLLVSNGVPTSFPRPCSYSCIQMNGKEVFRFAVRCVPQSIEASLERAGLMSSSIDWLLLHQVLILYNLPCYICCHAGVKKSNWATNNCRQTNGSSMPLQPVCRSHLIMLYRI